VGVVNKIRISDHEMAASGQGFALTFMAACLTLCALALPARLRGAAPRCDAIFERIVRIGTAR
jgi:hypothetical protein